MNATGVTNFQNLNFALENMRFAMGISAFREVFGGVSFRIDPSITDENGVSVPGLYEPVGDGGRISLNPDLYSTYRDSWTPFQHEMFHRIDHWISFNIYRDKSPTFVSENIYALDIGGFQNCQESACSDWGQRPWEDFASMGALYVNIMRGLVSQTDLTISQQMRIDYINQALFHWLYPWMPDFR